MNEKLKEQLEKLWAEIDKEMRDKSEIAEKMMRIQEEFQLTASMLNQESEAHAMTQKAQEEAEAKLRAETEAAAAAAEAARKKREADAAALAAKQNQASSLLKLNRAADRERRRKEAEAAQKELEEMSAEAQRKMIEEQMKIIGGLEQELGRAGDDAIKAEEVGARLMKLHETVKEREAQLLALKAQIEAMELKAKADKSAWDTERRSLEDKLQSEGTARRVRERYAEDLSKKLKLAKLEIIKLGRKPKMFSKEVQTTYAEMWVRNFLDEDDVAERRSGWVPQAVLARKDAKKGGVVSAAGAASTRNTIVTILSEKVKADMAAVRDGKTPMQLPQFTYSYFYTRYGLPAPTEERLLEFAEAVHKHRGVPEVARFGLSCGLLGEDDEAAMLHHHHHQQQQQHPHSTFPVAAGGASGAAGALAGFGGRVTTRSVGTGDDAAAAADHGGGGGGASSPSTLRASVPTDVNRVLIRGRTTRTATVDEVVAIRNVGDAGVAVDANRGGFATGLQLAPGDSNLLGVDTRHLNHALALDLAELQSKVVPTVIKHELLMHPLAEEAAEALGSAVGMDSILGYVADRSFADAMAGVDLGIMVGVVGCTLELGRLRPMGLKGVALTVSKG